MYPGLLLGIVFEDDPLTIYDVSEQIVSSCPAFTVGGSMIVSINVAVESQPLEFVVK